MSFSINDPIHSVIDLDDREKSIIDNAAFQRLRRIKALGFLDRVFPSAKHSRFEHSIGACHVASQLCESMEKISRSLGHGEAKWIASSEFTHLGKGELDKLFDKDLRSFVRVAALLHDIGHGPFSHASEAIMPSISELLSQNPDASCFVKQALRKKCEKAPAANADHEDYSLLLLDRILSETGWSKEDRHTVAALKSSEVDPPSNSDPMIISLLRQLVSGELDSDRLDYLRRDSYFCGVPYGQYDLKRLKEGLCVVKNKAGELRMGIMRKALSALEDFLFARFQMHVQIYTHKVDASCNKSFEQIAKQSGYRLPANVQKYIEIDDENLLKEDSRLERLKDILDNRVLWRMAFESFSDDKTNEQVLLEALKQSLPPTDFAVYNSERPIKKPEILSFPVVCKAFGGAHVTNGIRAISDLVAHYNATYTVTRLFYDPKHEAVVKSIRERIATPLDVGKELKNRRENLAGIDLGDVKQPADDNQSN